MSRGEANYVPRGLILRHQCLSTEKQCESTTPTRSRHGIDGPQQTSTGDVSIRRHVTSGPNGR